jgi:hypothetical protein
MKKLYLLFVSALFLIGNSILLPQISEVTRLPVQNVSQSIKESAPVWLSENEIIIFFVNETMDTIFSTKSNDRGISWEEPEVVQTVNLLVNQERLYLNTFQTSSGRILLVWSVLTESMKLIYSDDRGETWFETIDILGAGSLLGRKSSAYLNITQWNSGVICLSFTAFNTNFAYYKLSLDDGKTWSSDAILFPGISGFRTRELSIISLHNNELLAVFERNDQYSSGIYAMNSSDSGTSWSQPITVADGMHREIRPKIAKHENFRIILMYLRDEEKVADQYVNNSIYYKESNDNGNNWSQENRFTKYVGEDNFISLSSFQNNTFFSFGTERFSVITPGTISFQLAYAILEESVEQFTPPKIYYVEVPQELIDLEKKEFVLKAIVSDDEAVKSVSVTMADSTISGELFDDGMHNDGEANDDIFGNTFSFGSQRYMTDFYLEINNIKMPFNNSGLLADINYSYSFDNIIVASDFKNNQCISENNIDISGPGSHQAAFEEGTFLFSGGFFLSGYTDGQMWANAVASAALVQDYQSGIFGSDSDEPRNVIYVVERNDSPFGISWQRWKDAVSLGAIL